MSEPAGDWKLLLSKALDAREATIQRIERDKRKIHEFVATTLQSAVFKITETVRSRPDWSAELDNWDDSFSIDVSFKGQRVFRYSVFFYTSMEGISANIDLAYEMPKDAGTTEARKMIEDLDPEGSSTIDLSTISEDDILLGFANVVSRAVILINEA